MLMKSFEEGLTDDKTKERRMQCLRDMLEDEDRLQKVKRSKLKREKKELIDGNVELKSQIAYIESELNEKNTLAKYLENQRDQLRESSARDQEIIRLKVQKEQLQERNEEELKEIIERQNIKLNKKQQEHALAVEKSERMERKQQNAIVSLEQEKNNLLSRLQEEGELLDRHKIQLADTENRLDKLVYEFETEKNKKDVLQQELNVQMEKYAALNSQYVEECNLRKELEVREGIFENRLKDQEQKIIDLEAKVVRQKQKHSEELSILGSEKDQEIIRKKQNIQGLKAELKNIQNQIDEQQAALKASVAQNGSLNLALDQAQRQYAQLQAKNTQLSQHGEQLEQEMKKQKSIHRQISDSTTADKIELTRLTEEQVRLSERLRNSEAKAVLLEEELVEKIKQLEATRKELAQAEDAKIIQKSVIHKLERQNQFLVDTQSDETEKLEEKVESLRKQLKAMQNHSQMQNMSSQKNPNGNQRNNNNNQNSYQDNFQSASNSKQLQQGISRKIDQLQRSDYNGQKSILKKPRFNLVNTDSDESQENSD